MVFRQRREACLKLSVAFDIDANGVLNVKAKDKATISEQSIRIEGSSGSSEDEKKKRMTAGAENSPAKMLKSGRISQSGRNIGLFHRKMIKDNDAKI